MASLNPEGPLPVWHHSSPYFDHMSVSFLWNKENKQNVLPGEKKI